MFEFPLVLCTIKYIAKSRSVPCHLKLYKKENISSVNRRIPAETSFRKDCWGQISCLFEPRCEKTGLRDFRPGPTQTGLYSY